MRVDPRLGFRVAILVALALGVLPSCGRTPQPSVVVPNEPAKPPQEDRPSEGQPAANPLTPLVQDLSAADAEKRRQAADRLGHLGDSTVGPRLAQRVSDDTFSTAEEKFAALNALKALAPELLDEALWNALRSRNPRVRSWALEEMKRRDEDDDLNEKLVRALQDDNPDVRREAAEVLHQRRAVAHADALARRVADDRFASNAEKDAALAALQALAPDRLKAALAEAEQSTNAQVKEWAGRARVRVTAAAPPRPRRNDSGPPALERDWFGDGERVNLLRLSGVQRSATSALGDEADGLGALTDGDPATVAVATPTVAGLDVVYECPTIVTPEQLLVRLPANNPPGAATGRVEVLVSTISAHAGFQALRTVALEPSGTTQSFLFTPAAARWIRLRFHAAEGAGRVAVAEVAVVGLNGPPRTLYGFKESPARALDLLARLRTNAALKLTVHDDEAALFADVKEGHFRSWSFAEAALLASGVSDAAKRKEYAERLDGLEAEARTAVAGAGTPFEKGEKLLRWLHAGPLSGGYRSGQTDLHTVLNDKTFNCVSSAVLYNVLALRLGLDARAIEVPDHAFTIVYDSTRHADVETTIAVGFELGRDRAARRQFRDRTGFVYVPDRFPERRRELREAGLVAVIFYNHAVAALNRKHYEEALLGFFKALSLDTEDALSVQLALATLAEWSGDLAERSRFDDALTVLATGLELAPTNATLLHQRRAVWANWALKILKDGKEDEALALLDRAVKAVPEDTNLFRTLTAYVFIHKGEEHIKAGKWDEAFALVEPALARLDGPAKEEFRAWATDLSLRQAQSEFAARRYEQAAAVLSRGLQRNPGNERLGQYLGYIVQEWVARVDGTDGAAKAEALLAELLKRHADVPAVQRGANGYLLSRVLRLVQTEKFGDAVAYVVERAKLFQGKPDAREVIVAVYDRWAEILLQRKQWAAAAECYGEALKRYPNDEHLKHNATAVWDAWAGSHIDVQDWAAAVDVYGKALGQLPENAHVLNNLGYVVHRQVKATTAEQGKEAGQKLLAAMQRRFPKLPGTDLVFAQVRELANAKRFQEALDSLDAGRDLVTDQAKWREEAVRLFERWVNHCLEVKDWPGAVEVAQKGLDRFPDEPRLTGAVTKVLETVMRGGTDGAEASARRRAVMKELLARNPKLTEKLSSDLRAKDPRTRKAAAEGLHALAATDAVEALADRVADDVWYISGYSNVPSDPEAGGKTAALEALGTLAPERVEAALGEAAKAKSLAVRQWAVRQLVKRKDRTAVEVLCRALRDGEPNLRKEAAELLDGTSDRSAIKPLADRVADDVWYISGYTNVPDDPEGGGKAGALKVLRSLDAAEGTKALLRATASKKVEVRAWALGELVKEKGAADNAEIIKALEAGLRDADSTVEMVLKKAHIRVVAADGLRTLKATGSAGALAERVADDVWYQSGYSNVPNDPEGGGKAAALRALQELAPDRVAGALESAAKSKTEAVRKWAGAELKKLKGEK
jgi:tetratricopeptide (TPR) repeat protein